MMREERVSYFWCTVFDGPRWDWDLSSSGIDVYVERSDNGVKYRTEYGTEDRRDIRVQW